MPPRGKQPAVRDPPPPLPGGYKVGEKVFFMGPSFTFPSGDRLVHGQQGEVTGPASGERYMVVHFPGNTSNFSVLLTGARRPRAASACVPPSPRP